MVKKIILWLVVLTAVVGVGLFVAGYLAPDKSTESGSGDPVDGSDTATQRAADPATLEELGLERPIPEEFKDDIDRDGVPDTLEEELGTSNREFDTDGDGLSDKLEIEKYKTDPTKVDSDGDGFADALEVLGGFNPNGEGKLPEDVAFQEPEQESALGAMDSDEGITE